MLFDFKRRGYTGLGKEGQGEKIGVPKKRGGEGEVWDRSQGVFVEPHTPDVEKTKTLGGEGGPREKKKEKFKNPLSKQQQKRLNI